MARGKARGLRLALASLIGLFVVAGGVAIAASAHRSRGLSVRQVLGESAKSATRVIVLLRDQHANLPPTQTHVGARVRAVQSDQQPLEASVKSSGGTINHSFHTVNAFAATVSGAERSRLASDSSVAEVLPDTAVKLPVSGGPQVVRITPRIRRPHSGQAPAPAANGGQQICPADPSKPLLEPEALGIIHATQAQQLVTGAGVKVAFIADGLDINNPDFIRLDGSHVFVDYRDFSGEGINAPTNGAEAFGDASSIAAQGRVVYDLSKYVNPAHPLPAGCNIILRGVAPGASLVGMKVFGKGAGAFTSTILQGMDWAVSQDHVNVLNESFGADNLPDTDQDVTKQFNRLAVAAGVTVTVSSGDQGTANTIGSPASDPSAISVAATTQFQHFAQTDRGGYQLSPRGWVNENIAEFSSGGVTQSGRTVDLAAPGNENYEPCTADTTQYNECTNFAGQPSNLRSFGGTSESAPLTAGAAALVIQAYRQTHGGSSPAATLVKQIITSNTNDLNIPSYEQGAGELDVLAAVKAAESINSSSGTGDGRLVSPNQLDLAQPAGSSAGSDVKLTNVGSGSQTFSTRLRALSTSKLSDDHGDVTLNPATDPQFVDQLGVPQAYREIHFTVPAGADRIDASLAHPGPTHTVNMTLFDPSGRFEAFTYHPAADGADYSHIDVRNPPAGTWTAAFFTPAGNTGYAGAVHFDISTSRFATAGTVTPSSVTLAPGASTSLHVSLNAPSTPGDYSRDVQITSSSGRSTVVPVVIRSLVPLGSGHGSFAGTITGGNGNGSVGREDTLAFDIPPGSPTIHAQFRLIDDPPNPPGAEIGFLVSPDGQALGQEAATQSGGDQVLQMFRPRPQPGRWRLVILTPNPVGGTTTAAPFTGTIDLQTTPLSASGVPDSPAVRIGRGASTTATVTVTNPGNSPLNVFIDPRRSRHRLYSLLSLNPATGLALPISAAGQPPLFAVPSEVGTLVAAAHASAPITFDWGFGDPDLEARSFGDNAVGSFSAQQVTPGVWFIAPALIGPFTSPGSATVDTGLVALARGFDQSVTSSTGDPQLLDVDPSASPGTPVTLAPGAKTKITVTFAPTGRRGAVVSGDLFVDDWQAGSLSASELGSIPYRYRIG